MTTYKPHFACFECRKTFKRRLLSDIKRGANDSVAAKCPECGSLTADMGLDFESPRQIDRKAWEHLKNLYTVGVTFHSCGCSGPGFIPKTGEQLLNFLLEKKRRFVENLQFWLNRKEAATKAEMERDMRESGRYRSQIHYLAIDRKNYLKPQTAIAYWNEKLADLDEKIRFLEKQENV